VGDSEEDIFPTHLSRNKAKRKRIKYKGKREKEK
jgi:hypothetical protein